MRAIGEVEFFERWEKQHAEWCKIRDELVLLGPVSAFDVSSEQRKRALRDGRTIVTATSEGFYEITPAEALQIAKAANA